jgi:hypothetical protein
MAWPNDNNITINFPKKFLPHVQYAIDNKQIKWGDVSMWASSCIAKFEWADCKWVMYESFETVYRIELRSGKLDSVDLTAAVLRG